MDDRLKSLFSYESPNNHVLHTLAAYLSVTVLGIEPWAVRMPAFLAGVAIIPVGATLARRLVWSLTERLSAGNLAGLWAAALLAGSSILVEYSINARGYSMLCLATLVQGLFGLSIGRNVRNVRAWLGWALTGALGLYVMPTMAYAIAISGAAMTMQVTLGPQRRQIILPFLGRLGACIIVTVILAALEYWPVFHFNMFSAVLANEYTRPKPWSMALEQNWRLAIAALADWLRDTSWLWQGLVARYFAASLLAAVRRRNAFCALPVLDRRC